MTDEQIKHMVGRFLGWPLPKNFSPDAGISYTRPNYHPSVDNTLVGTNLFDATQVEEMIRYVVDGMPGDVSGGALKDVTRVMLLEAALRDVLPSLRSLVDQECPDPAVAKHDRDLLEVVEALVAVAGTAPLSDGQIKHMARYLQGSYAAGVEEGRGHQSTMPEISELTWEQRFQQEFERHGGSTLSTFAPRRDDGPPGWLRAQVAEDAIASADRSMLNEIYLMLRVLLGRHG